MNKKEQAEWIKALKLLITMPKIDQEKVVKGFEIQWKIKDESKRR